MEKFYGLSLTSLVCYALLQLKNADCAEITAVVIVDSLVDRYEEARKIYEDTTERRKLYSRIYNALHEMERTNLIETEIRKSPYKTNYKVITKINIDG